LTKTLGKFGLGTIRYVLMMFIYKIVSIPVIVSKTEQDIFEVVIVIIIIIIIIIIIVFMIITIIIITIIIIIIIIIITIILMIIIIIGEDDFEGQDVFEGGY
jgi:hypothetical protein